MTRKTITFTSIIAATVFMVGCGGNGGSNSALPPAPPAGATTVPTATPTATVSPTPTPTVTPTFTPVPSASPTATPTPTPSPSFLPDTVEPIFDCVGHSGSSFYMLFGYNNPTAAEKTLTANTPANMMTFITSSGSTPYTGQPSVFAVGLNDKAFQVPLPTGEVSVQWTLDGNTIGPISKESTSCTTGGK